MKLLTCSADSGMMVSKAYCKAWYKPLAENTCILQLKSRQHICFILLLKTTLLQMATNCIGAFLFIWFLQRNKHLLRKNNDAKINDNALVALALLVAQSDPSTKDLMVKLIMNLISE